MARDLLVRIKGSDELSPIFKDVASSAGEAESEFDDLNRKMQETDRESQEIQRSLKDLENDARNVGHGIGVLIAALSLSGKSFRDQQLELATLERNYGSVTERIIDFADQIQTSTNFSNDAAIATANTFAVLRREYDLTASQIEQLIARTADLAAINPGASLEQVAAAVTKAIDGQGESLRNYGVIMSDVEGGGDSFNAFMSSSAFAMGAAAEQAEDTYGSLANLRDGINDASQAFGGFLGPVGQAGAFLADHAIQTALVSAGLWKLGTAARSSAAIMGALSLSMGPVGLASAAGVAMLALWELDRNLDNSYRVSVERATEATGDLDDAVRDLFRTGNTLAFLGQRSQGLFPGIEEDIENMNALEGQIATLTAQGGPQNDEQRQMLQGWVADLESLIDKYGVLSAEQLASTITSRQFADAQEALNLIMRNQGEGAQLQQDYLESIFDRYDAGAINITQLMEAIIATAEWTGYFDERAAGAAASMLELGSASAEAASQLMYLAEAQNALAKAGDAAFRNVVENLLIGKDAAREFGIEALYALEALSLLFPAADAAFRNVVENLFNRTAADEAAGGLRGYREEVDDVSAALREFQQAQDEVARSSAIEQLEADWSGLSAALTSSGDALENTFRIIVGNTNAWASASQGVADWADELIKAEGVYSALDDLVLAGRITGESGVFTGTSEYAQAQQAYNSLMLDNAAIQEHVLTIQAKQAPIIAELVAQQERRLGILSEMEGAEQRAALAMMDTTTNAQALEVQLALLNGAGADAMQPMIQGMVDANPLLGEVLAQMGLIAVDHEGTVTLNVDGATSPIADLAVQIGDLVDTLYVIFLDADPLGANLKLGELEGRLKGLDESVHSPTVSLRDNASAGLAAIQAALWGLTDRTVTVTTRHVATGFVSGLTFGNADGGVIPRMADGGVAVLGAEVGREMVRRGDGGISFMDQPGIYNLSPGDMVIPAPATRQLSGGATVSVSVSVNGNVYGMDDLTHEIAKALAPALVGAIEDRERANL